MGGATSRSGGQTSSASTKPISTTPGLALAMLFALAGCTTAMSTPACPLPGQSATQSLRFYFGRNIPGGGVVSDTDWTVFAADILTPAFPDGFSVYAAQGQWRGADGVITREPSIVVEHEGRVDPGQTAAIVTAYKIRFRQESVGVVTMPACMEF